MPSPDTIRILIAIVPVVLIIFGIVRRPVYTPIGYMSLIYCKVTNYYPIYSTIKAELLFALIILIRLLLIPGFIEKISFRNNLINRYLCIFIGCVFLSFAVAWNHQHSWDYSVYHFVKVLLLYFMILLSINSENDMKIFIWGFVLMYAYLAYEPVYGFITKTGGSEHMYGTNYIGEVGILSGHVALANNMNQMIPIAYYMFLYKKSNKLYKILSAIPFIVFVLSLVGSGSRGGIIGFAFFGICVVYFSENRKKAGLVFIAVILLIGLYSQKIIYTASRISSHQTEGRLTGAVHGFEMIRKGNLIGVGPGCFRIARGHYFGFSMDAHNLYGQLFGDLGIPGTIAWFFLMRQVYYNLRTTIRYNNKKEIKKSFILNLAFGLQISLVVQLLVGLGSHGLYFFYWYVVACLSTFMLKFLDEKSIAS